MPSATIIFLVIGSTLGGIFALILLFVAIFIAWSIFKAHTSPRKFFYQKIDNYIIKYHSDEYIRRCLIKDEIKRRIDNAVAENNKIRDEQESSLIEKIKLDFKIQEDGWCAEIEHMEKLVKSANAMRDDVMKLRHKVERWGRELAIITAENSHVGNKIVDSTNENLGELEKIGIKAGDVVKEIAHDAEADERMLRMR